MTFLKILERIKEYEMLEKVKEAPPEESVKDYIRKIKNNK